MRLVSKLAAGAALLAFGSLPVSAQSVSLGADVWREKAPCRACHGSFGDGIPDVAQSVPGASLRYTKLEPDQIAEVIKCGRPGTPMPYFDRGAYTDDRCFGLTREAIGKDMPDKGDPVLNDREVASIVMFIVQNFIGKGDPTFEECTAFWGPRATTCANYPKKAP
jgi:mono/diheme cytochrome c family protein